MKTKKPKFANIRPGYIPKVKVATPYNPKARMKITGDDTRMVEVAPGEFVHVRGRAFTPEAAQFSLETDGDLVVRFKGEQFDKMVSRRILILELAE